MDASLRQSARLAPFRAGISLRDEQEQRLPDLDFISVPEGMLLQGKAVDVSAIGAPAVGDAELLPDGGQYTMVPGDRGIFDTECVVDRSPDGKFGAFVLREREDSPDQRTGDGNQLWHSPKGQRVQYTLRAGTAR